MTDIKPKGFVDYTGFKKGKATVTSFHSWHYQPSGQRKSKWNCDCECGNTFVATGANLKAKNHTTSCGCAKKEAMKKYREDYSIEDRDTTKLIGQRFGRLVVTDFVKWDKMPSSEAHYSTWKCLCDCGNTIDMRRSYLKTNEVPSCGCHASEMISQARTTHGMTRTPTYRSWTKMKERCGLDTYIEKEYYQDKGITVCDTWLNSFETFLADMGERPEGCTLDRIDGSLGYSKDNCRWADLTIQSYNREIGSNNTSGRVGVYERSNGWFASITHYKKYIILVSGVSFEAACKAREEAELKYYGWTK